MSQNFPAGSIQQSEGDGTSGLLKPDEIQALAKFIGQDTQMEGRSEVRNTGKECYRTGIGIGR